MKKRFLVFTVLAILFAGCSSSDSDGGLAITEANVLGKWVLKGIKLNSEPIDLYEHSCTTKKDFNEIFSNHHIVFTGYGTDCEVNDGEDNEWYLEGSVFTIDYGGLPDAEVYQIVKLTNNEMQMKQVSGSDTYIYYLNKI